MGKYMKKAKALGGEVAVMEVPHQTSLGVRTRARTLALQQRRPIASTSFSLPEEDNNASSYLQLRNRRLEKPPFSKPKDQSCNVSSPRSGLRSSSSSRVPEPVHSGSVVGSVSVCCSRREEATAAAASDASPEIQVSFGENVIDVETRGRYNFDPVNEQPLPGRYEWAKSDD